MTDLTSGVRCRRAPGRRKILKVVKPVSIAESAQCSLVRCPAQPLSREQTSLYPKSNISFPVHRAPVVAGATTPYHTRNRAGR
jgi:hypothetical protein